jgi:hypothetical protein
MIVRAMLTPRIRRLINASRAPLALHESLTLGSKPAMLGGAVNGRAKLNKIGLISADFCVRYPPHG